MPTLQKTPPLTVTNARYVKLGRGGNWAAKCITDGTVRLGFDTYEYWDICIEHKWDELRKRYLQNHSPGIATNRCNQVREFFEDDGSTLWFTFYQTLMYWALIDPRTPAQQSPDGDGTFRQTQDGWSSKTVTDDWLFESKLSGHLGMAKRYQGTSYSFQDVDYLIRRINGQKSKEAEQAEQASKELLTAISAMMNKLTENDFELLVDLIFSSSGWRRLGATGGTQELLDIELQLPSTGARAFVQVKSKANQREFDDEYRDVFSQMPEDQYERMFYAYHSGNIVCTNKNITLLDHTKLARMVLDAGLVNWLIEKVA